MVRGSARGGGLMLCKEKHLPEIPEKDWLCPECGKKEWVIDDSHDMDCEGVMSGDWLNCYDCGHGQRAATFYRAWARQKSMILCPNCKGAGHVAVGRK